MTDYLFSRLGKLQEPGFHPKWKDVNLNAKVPGLERFPAAQEWLDSAAATRPTATQADKSAGAVSPQPGAAAGSPTPEQVRLFQEFLDWRRQHGK